MRFALLLLAMVVSAGGCGHGAAAQGPSGPRVLLAYDDGKSAGMVVFPNSQYESIMRFEIPAGEHRLVRLWVQVASAGLLAVTIYGTNMLDAPGDPIGRIEREIQLDEVSNGRDGLWVVQDLSQLPKCTGIVWLGFKKVAGAPTLWSSRVISGRYFLRSDATDLLPVKETPLARLEITP